MPSGDASEEEAAQIHNMNRTAILYEMMMTETLEKIDPFDDAGEACLDDLARRVAPLLPNWPQDTICDALQQARERDGLRLERAPDEKMAWRWVDFLPAPQGR